MYMRVPGHTRENDAANYDIPRPHQYFQYDSNKFSPGK